MENSSVASWKLASTRGCLKGEFTQFFKIEIYYYIISTKSYRSLYPLIQHHFREKTPPIFPLGWDQQDPHAKQLLVGGWPTLLKNMSSSVGMMTFPIHENIKAMFQITNQTQSLHPKCEFFICVKHPYIPSTRRPLREAKRPDQCRHLHGVMEIPSGNKHSYSGYTIHGDYSII